MSNQLKNVMIGIFVLAAFAIIVFILLFLHPNIGNEGKTLRVRFADIDKINPGTRVTFAGKPIGEVLRIDEIDNGKRIERDGIIYVYELLLAIDTGVQVYVGDEISSRTSGLLGEKSVAIIPAPPQKNEPQIPVTDQIIYARETGSLESTIKEVKSLSNKIQVTLDGFIEALNTLHDQHAWENLSKTINNLNEMISGINETKAWEPLNNAIRKIDSMMTTFTESNSAERLNKTISNLEEMSASLNQPEKISQILNNISSVSSSVKNITSYIEQGEGTLGKIIMRDDLNLSLASIMSKAEVILNDINHYGILFHQDKGWQRLRARRLNLLQKLSTPQEFRNYFNDEIDSISTSLERVSMVIEEIDALPCCCDLLEDSRYSKVYAELLRRVATLEEYLQMYNQQVMQSKVGLTEFINPCE